MSNGGKFLFAALGALSGSRSGAGHGSQHRHGYVHGTTGTGGAGGPWWVGLIVFGVVAVAFVLAVRHLVRKARSRRQPPLTGD